MKPLPTILFGLTALLIALPASAREVKVSMAKLKFNPVIVYINPGDTVSWVNDDDRGHTVVADDGSFNSGEIGIGGTYKQKFKTVGEFTYHCEHHPRMRGQVLVKTAPKDNKK